MTPIGQDVAAYEAWLGKQCAVVQADLDAKHHRMRKSGFDFLRATYFRWARTIETVCPALSAAPRILCIGDLHVENYGTWRDADARLVWGINDFDEAATMPYAFDLLRLATSATLSPDMRLHPADLCATLLKGYRRGLQAPQAMLLDENAGGLRSYVNPTARSNAGFWEDVDACPDAQPPAPVQKALKDSLPPGARVQRYASRRKGGGSLGRPRFLVVATWNSGRVVREAKALVPSAWVWAHGTKEPCRFLDVASGAYRSPDPLLSLEAGFILRRSAPDSRKIEFADVQAGGLTEDLVAAMATDLASVHAAGAGRSQIAADLDGRPDGWLQQAVEAAKAATEQDHAAYVALGGA